MLLSLLTAVVAPGAATAFELLLERKLRDGRVSTQLVRGVAELYGKSEETIWRWLRYGRPSDRETFRLNEAEKRALAACNGSVALMVVKLQREGTARASLRTYQRAVKSGSLTPAERQFFKKGDRGWRARTIHMPVVVERRGQIFHADHSLLEIWVRPKQGSRWVRVWLTVVIDAYSRLVMGWAVSPHPNEGTVLVALRDAFTGEYGCIPDRAVWDNAAEFVATGVTQASQSLAFDAHPIAPYSPWQNGKVERFFKTLEQQFLREQPFYMRGPRGHDGQIYGPAEGPLMLDEFVSRLASWIDWYNRERPHSSLGGRTPEQAWREPATAVRRIDEQKLHFMLLREKESRSVGVHGVRHRNRFYYADELLTYKSETINVRYMPHDDRKIWLFDEDELIAEAIPWELMGEKQRGGFLSKRSGTLTSARSKLPSRRTQADEPADVPLPTTAPGDVTNAAADADEHDPAATDLMTPLAQAVSAVIDEDEESAEEDRYDGLYEPLD